MDEDDRLVIWSRRTASMHARRIWVAFYWRGPFKHYFMSLLLHFISIDQ